MWLIYTILGIIVVYVAWTFNRFVRLRQRARGSWSDIDVQLKRRWDLIPTLVATVEGYTTHEKDTLNKVVEARSRATEGFGPPKLGQVAQRGDAELLLGSAVMNVLGLVEAYPALKADQSFLSLHTSLIDIEDHVQHARRYYNAVVRDYNTLIESFPSRIVAAVFRFGGLQFFQIDAAERATPRVDLRPG